MFLVEFTMKNVILSNLIDTYLEGWKMGDGELSLGATHQSFTYDDPNTGTIKREDFVAFVNDFKTDAVALGAEENVQPFLKYSDTVVEFTDYNSATIWCWWHANGTDLQGSAVIKASDQGVLHEKIAYFSKLP